MIDNIHNIQKAYLKKQLIKYKHFKFEGKSLLFSEVFWNAFSLKVFLDEGFNINEVDIHGKTPIFYCKNKKQLMVFLANGANIHHIDHYKRNILFHSLDPEIVKFSLGLNLNLKSKDIYGRYFLSYPIFHSYPQLFTDYLFIFKNERIEIFQLFESSLISLKKLDDNLITMTFPKIISLRFDPNRNQVTLEKIIKYIEQKIGKKEFEKIRFIYEEKEENVITLCSSDISKIRSKG